MSSAGCVGAGANPRERCGPGNRLTSTVSQYGYPR